MSRYRGPKLKIIHRLEKELAGFTTKSEKYFSSQKYKQRQNQERKKNRKDSAYKVRLLEKQKLRYNYGITERQLVQYVKQAKSCPGRTGFLILQSLEMRFDNIIFRLGLAPTIPAARQLINHGHFLINNKKVTIPSFSCWLNDKITLLNKETSKNLVKDYFNRKETKVPMHLALEINVNNFIGSVVGRIKKEDLGIQVNELAIVEYYSRIL